MPRPALHLEFVRHVAVLIPAWNRYMAAWDKYDECPNNDTRSELSVLGVEFEEAWKALSSAHNRMNQSTPYRTNLYGHK